MKEEIVINVNIPLCPKCKDFEDTGLKDYIAYGKNGRVKGRVQVRFYCHAYMEYLTKLRGERKHENY